MLRYTYINSPTQNKSFFDHQKNTLSNNDIKKTESIGLIYALDLFRNQSEKKLAIKNFQKNGVVQIPLNFSSFFKK